MGCGASGWQYERVSGFVLRAAWPGTAPIYRFWNESLKDHYYSTDGRAPGGYVNQVRPVHGPNIGTVPLYHLYEGNPAYDSFLHDRPYGIDASRLGQCGTQGSRHAIDRGVLQVWSCR